MKIKKKKFKIIFLVSEDNYLIYDFLKKIFLIQNIDTELVIIQEYKEPLKRKILFSFLFGILDTFKILYEIKIKRNQLSIEKLCKKKNVKFIKTLNINNINVINSIKKNNSNLIINLNVMKLFKKNFITKFNKKLINFHPGILPTYRGLYSTFYKILNKENYYGISAHLMTNKIDEGDILTIVKKKITNKNLLICYTSIYRVLIFILFKKIIKIYSRKKIMIYKKKSTNKYPIYKHPTMFQILKYKLTNTI